MLKKFLKERQIYVSVRFSTHKSVSSEQGQKTTLHDFILRVCKFCVTMANFILICLSKRFSLKRDNYEIQ